MKAIRLHRRGHPEDMAFEDAPDPMPHPEDVVVRVQATAITPGELGWMETWTDALGKDRTPTIPGHDLCGVVQEVGSDAADVKVGDVVYGLTAFDRDGCAAERVAVRASEVAPCPRGLDPIQAAAVPLSALTAWQALFVHGRLEAGQTVLIHGGAGGVGAFAVQLARWKGARVLVTSSARHAAWLRDRGADEVIDYESARFEDVARDVDVVLDTVGGECLWRSWSVLRAGGILVDVATVPSEDDAAAHGVRCAFFIVEPNREQLLRISELIEEGVIKPEVHEVFPLEQAPRAYERAHAGHLRGKIVLQVQAT